MKTGLFFGSFNPVHVGHMVIANYMLEYGGLDQLWFIVSPQNPLKDKNTLLDARQRLHLVRLAIGDNPRMRASDIEFTLPRPSYTINTLTYLGEKYPDRKFSLILGSDNLETFHKWKNYEEILKRFSLCVYPRPGAPGGALLAHPAVQLVNTPLMEISSTMIRNAIGEGRDMRYFLPEQAWTYLEEMHFYSKPGSKKL